jgi:hypothetical protein
VNWGERGKWEMSERLLFLEIYSGLMHLTPFTYQEWLLYRKQKKNARVLLFSSLKFI